MSSSRLFLCSLAAGVLLTACDRTSDSAPRHEANAPAVPEEPAARTPPKVDATSIIRPAVQAEAEAEAPPPPPQPVSTTVSFATSGTRLDDAGKAALDELLAAPALRDGSITLRGHSDSKGDDKANLNVSRRRAEAVRDYLVGKGVPADRITIVALGETRPLVPNARPDGSDDEEARARNRRVDVELIPAPPPAEGGEEIPLPAGVDQNRMSGRAE